MMFLKLILVGGIIALIKAVIDRIEKDRKDYNGKSGRKADKHTVGKSKRNSKKNDKQAG